MVNDRQVLHQLARNCKAGLVGLIRLGQSMQIRPLEIANSKAGLIVLGSLALAWLLPGSIAKAERLDNEITTQQGKLLSFVCLRHWQHGHWRNPLPDGLVSLGEH